jgi:hypothetical protein
MEERDKRRREMEVSDTKSKSIPYKRKRQDKKDLLT